MRAGAVGGTTGPEYSVYVGYSYLVWPSRYFPTYFVTPLSIQLGHLRLSIVNY